MGERFEGWDDRDTSDGLVRRFDKQTFTWTVVKKSRFPRRQRIEEGDE